MREYTSEEEAEIREMAEDMFSAGIHTRGDNVDQVVLHIKSAIEGTEAETGLHMSSFAGKEYVAGELAGPNRHERRRARVIARRGEG